MELTKIQKWRSTPLRNFLLNFKLEDPLLICIFEVEDTFNLDLLKQQDLPLIWTTLSAGNLYKNVEEGSFCSLPDFSSLPGKSIGTRTGFYRILVHTEDQLRHPD